MSVAFDQTLEEAFPPIEPGLTPLGERVLLQVMTPPKKTKSGLILADYTKDTIHDNSQVAKVIALGALAFKNRSSGEAWREGPWYKVGDFVRIPKYLGDRVTVKLDEDTSVTFTMLKDHEVIGLEHNPLARRGYL